ncbi:MAG TPA: ketoacyl-ACP synthase III [Burkholderiales bacterium]|nr:ketoacyl-ACP synthase III [Burkholderiales bacterium]
MTLGIEAIAHAFGSRRIDNVAEGARQGFDSGFVRDKLGIATRYAAAEDEATSDLAAAAVKAVLEKTRTAPEAVGGLIVVTQTPDYQLPHTAALVQKKLGLPASIASFDVSLGCSGYVYGLSAAIGLMQQAAIERAVLVTADCYSKVMDAADRATAPLFSDAAAATVLGARPLYRAGKPVFGTDGSGAETLIVKCGGSRAPAERSMLYMDGRAIYSFAMSQVPRQVEQCLKLNGLAIGDIDCFVFHQANRFMLESLRDRMKLPADKVVIDVADGGNTVGSTIPIALEPLLETRPRRILVCGFGVGLSWATNVLELCGEH